MNKNELRTSMRKLVSFPHQQNSTRSQSPTHKKLLKKIEQTQREIAEHYELSLQDNLIFEKPQEEVVDFRVEIERRYQHSYVNHGFVFPKKIKPKEEGNLDSSTSSNDSSFASLRHVTVYDLASQNHRRAAPVKITYKHYMENTVNGHKSTNPQSKVEDDSAFIKPKAKEQSGDGSIYSNADRDDIENDEIVEMKTPLAPLELHSQELGSSMYKNFANLVEKQVNEMKTPIAVDKKTPNIQQHEDYHIKEEKKFLIKPVENMNDGVKKPENKQNISIGNAEKRESKFIKDGSQRAIGYHIGKIRIEGVKIKDGKSNAATVSFQEGLKRPKLNNSKASELIRKFKYAQDQEKSSLMERSHDIGTSVMSIESRISPNLKKTFNDISRISPDKKNAYNLINSSGNLRVLTPTSMDSKNILTWKEVKSTKNVRSPALEFDRFGVSKSPINNLYQKAQDNVLNGKLRVEGQKFQKDSIRKENEVVKKEKEELYKPINLRWINFAEAYGSPKSNGVRSSTNLGQGVLKGRTVRKAGENIGCKSTDRLDGHISHDNLNKSTATRPTFKLDLSCYKSPKNKEELSSGRTRGGKSKEKSSEKISIESIVKNSYDMQNHSLVRNGLNKVNKSKKRVELSPKGAILFRNHFI